jgi:ATP-dependent protease Clp ATPase subunit
LDVRYRKNVPVGRPLRLIGKAEDNRKRLAKSTARIFGPDGGLLAEAQALLIDVPQDVLDSADLQALGWKVYPIKGAIEAG